MRIPLPLTSYQSYSRRESQQSLINLYAVPTEAFGRSSTALYPTPGLTTFYTVSGATNIVGLFKLGSLVYIVYNTSTVAKLGSIDVNGTFTDIGTVSTINANTVSMSAISGVIMIITDTGSPYLYTVSGNTLVAIASNFPTGAVTGTALQGYFIAIKPNSNTFYVSNLSDGTTWNALSFASTNTSNTNIVAATTLYQQLYFFTQNTVEIWSLTGATPQPFAPQVGNFFNYGCVAARTVVLTHNSLIWLSQNDNGQGMILQAVTGNSPKIISTEALTYQLSTYSTISDAFSYSYQMGGHEFYVITFPTAGKTWQYDVMTGYWNELQSFDTTGSVTGRYTRHRANCYSFLNGIHLVGDFATGTIFKLDPTAYLDQELYNIPRIVVTPSVSNQGARLSISSLELIVEPGQGAANNISIAPLVGLEVSRDSGFTYGNQRLLSVGLVGQYKRRVKWNQLGTARDFVFRITFTEAIKMAFLDLTMEANLENTVASPMQVPR